jgi:Bacterial Ig-like domain (group 3)
LNGDLKPDVLVANNCGTGFDCSTGGVGVLLGKVGFTTGTTLRSSLNPSIYGQKVTLSATVTSSAPTTVTGRVAFRWNQTYEFGRATLNLSGVATLTRSNLNADSFPVTAVYLGDAVHQGSTSAVLNQVVKPTTSRAQITSSLNPSTHGHAVTFTATISSPTVMATGPVTFTAGKTVLGTGQLSSGKARFTTAALPAGSTVVTATYFGDSNIANSSASLTQVVH